MAEAHWGIRPPGEQPVEVAQEPVHREARERLKRAVQAKLAQGFEIESQGDSQAVLVKGPRRCLGITLPGATTREIVSLDERGYPTVRTS
jgi:hypothetical protein